KEPLAAEAAVMLLHGAVGDNADTGVEALLERGAALGRIDGPRRLDLPEHVAHRLGPVLQHQRVGILAGGQRGEAQAVPRLQQRQGAVEGAELRAEARGIAVEAQHRLRQEAPQLLDLLLGERRAERRHGAAEAGAVQRDHVHIALGHDHRGRRLAFGLGEAGARLRPAIEHASLLEERRIGRVQIFRLAIAEHAAAEGDDAALAVADREHDAMAEIVVGLAALGAAQQPGLDQQRLGEGAGEGALQAVALLRRVAQAEAADGGGIESAALQIDPRLAPGGAREERFEMGAGGLHRALNARLPLGAVALFTALARHFETGLVRELLHRLGEGEVRRLHGEADDVAMRAAAETVIKALVLDDVERWRLFFVEGTEADILPSALDEAHAPADDVGERQTLAQLVEKPGWK